MLRGHSRGVAPGPAGCGNLCEEIGARMFPIEFNAIPDYRRHQFNVKVVSEAEAHGSVSNCVEFQIFR